MQKKRSKGARTRSVALLICGILAAVSVPVAVSPLYVVWASNMSFGISSITAISASPAVVAAAVVALQRSWWREFGGIALVSALATIASVVDAGSMTQGPGAWTVALLLNAVVAFLAFVMINQVRR